MQSPHHSTRSDVQRRESAGELLTQLYDGGGYRRFVRLALSQLSDRRWENGEDAVQSASVSFLKAFDELNRPIEEAKAYFIVAVKHHAYRQEPHAVPQARRPDRPLGGLRRGARRDKTTAESREALEVSDGPAGLAMQILGFERDEIAAALGVSDRGLRKVIGRGRQELRTQLEL